MFSVVRLVPSRMSNDANASSGIRNFTLSVQDSMMSVVGMDSAKARAREFAKIDAVSRRWCRQVRRSRPRRLSRN